MAKRKHFYECLGCGSVANTGSGKERRCTRCGGAKFRTPGSVAGSTGHMAGRHFLDRFE